MNKLRNPKAYGLPTNENYFVVDGFVWQIVRHDEVFDLYCMNKEVFELHEDGSESLLEDVTFYGVNSSSTYAIQVGYLDELKNAETLRQINYNLGIR